MIKIMQPRILSAVILAGLFSVSSAAFASPDKAGWGNPHKGMMDDDMPMMGHGKKGDWSDGKGMGMPSGHMTMRMRKVWNLDLSEKQRDKIRSIQRDLRAEVWKHEDAIEDVSDELFELYKAEPRDADAIGKVYAKIYDHRRQIIELQIDAGNKVYSELTKEQRAMLNKWGPKPKWGSGWGK